MLEANKALILLAPRAGFEPATNRLTAGCSTTELPGNSLCSCEWGAYNKASPPMKARNAEMCRRSARVRCETDLGLPTRMACLALARHSLKAAFVRQTCLSA